MRIAPLLALFFAAAALSGAGAQQPPASTAPSGEPIVLRQGAWTPTGLTVAEGDTLVFAFRLDTETRQWMLANGMTPTYSMQIGERVYPVTDGRRVAPAAGSLAVRAEFPIGPPSRWPDVGMTVQYEPLPPVPVDEGPIELNNGSGPVGTTDGFTGEIGRDPRPNDGRSPYRDRATNQGSQPVDDWTWLILPVAGGLGAALIIGLVVWFLRQPPVPDPDPVPYPYPDPDPDPEPVPAPTVAPPPIEIRPALDPLEGRLGGGDIALAGPEIRIGTRLERGAPQYRGTGPVIEREERDGGA